jgi:hypothetical protein
MPRPKEVLSPADYANYRNVRAVSVLFVVLGSVLVLGGIGLALDNKPNPQEQMPPAVAVGIALAGLAGAVGGVAALRGSRRWAPLVYVMAAVYVFGFPIGTILSFVLFSGLSRYLGSVERIRAAAARDDDPGN